MTAMRKARHRFFTKALLFTIAMSLAPAAMPARTVDRVIAKLNEDVIFGSDLAGIIMDKTGMPVSGDPVGAATAETFGALLDRTRLLQASKKMGSSVPADEMQLHVEEMIKEIRSHYPSEKEFLKAVAEQHSSLENLKKELLKKATVDYKVARAVGGRFTITDTDLERFEADSRKKGLLPVSYRLRRIGVLIEDQGNAGRSEAMDKAAGILETMKSKGMGFAEAANKYSQVPGEREVGGDLGFMPADKLAADLRAAVEKLEPGQATAPIVAGSYACVFYLEAERGARSALYERKFVEERGKLLAELRRKAHLQVYDTRLVKRVPAYFKECLDATPAPKAVSASTAPEPPETAATPSAAPRGGISSWFGKRDQAP
jgi:peptidyl-prolyl cis-trans isomerase SurA